MYLLLDRHPPDITDVTRREFIALLGAAGLLTGCSGAGSSGDRASAPRTRTVEHLGGTTDIPVDPQRVIVTDGTVAVGLIALGLTPVGVADNIDVFLAHVSPLLPDDLDPDAVATVLQSETINLEAIAALRPDLTLGNELDEELHPQLAAIAPTVLIERGPNGDWQRRLAATADILGRTARAERVQADYEQAIAELPPQVREGSVAFIRPEPDGQFRIDSTAGAFAGSVAADAGIPVFVPPAGIGEQEEGDSFVYVSGERLDILTPAELIVLPDFRDLGNETDGVTQFATNPLWMSLPAVAAGRVLQVPGLVYNGGNHYAAELLLRGIAEAST